MSTLSQFAGGGVKSVQRGSCGTGSNATITISPVNISKSFVLTNETSGRFDANVYGQTWATLAGLVLSSSTTLTLTGTGVSIYSYAGTLNWQVVEFY